MADHVANESILRLEEAMVAFADAYRRALSQAAHAISPELSPFGLRMLVHLAKRGAKASGAVAAHFDVDPAVVSRQVRQLEDLDLVTNVVDPRDRRYRIIEVTARGREHFESLTGLVHPRTVVETWPIEDVETLTLLIDRLARHTE